MRIQDLRQNYFPDDMRSVVCFLSVGALTAVIYFSLFALCWDVLQINYKAAVTVAYLTSVVFQFLSNRNLTFKSNGHIAGQSIKFIVLLCINYIITIAIVTGVVSQLKLSPYVGVLASVMVTVFIGFFLSKYWVYKK